MTRTYKPRPWLRKPQDTAPRPGEYKTHCIWGHEYTPENTIRDTRGNRNCRICTLDAQRRYRKRKAIARWQNEEK